MARVRFSRFKLLLLLAITLLGAFLRLYKVDSLPPSVGYDQADYGLDALAILGGDRPIFIPTKIAGREALFSYLVALAFLVLDDYSTAIYAVSAIIGILTIPIVYLAADEMFSTEEGPLAQWGGLLAALVTAISHWHLSWSRLGMRVILVPLFASLMVYFLWRGLRTGNRWMFAACGFTLGFSMYAYQAARILPLLVLFGFACVLWSRRSFSRRDGLNLALIVVIALVVFAPLGCYFLTHPGSASQRVEQALVVDSSQDLPTQARALFDQVVQAVSAFSVQGDRDPRVTIPGRPALNSFLSLVFILGVGVSLLRIRRPFYLVLLAWLVLMSVPAMLAQYGAVTKRALGAFPAVAMLIAVGLLVPCEGLRRWVAHRLPSWSRISVVVLSVAVGAGLVYTMALTCRDYFVTWAQNENLFIHFETGLSVIGKYVGGLPPGERVYVSPPPPDHPSILLFSNRREGIRGYNGRACVVLPVRAEQGVTYVIVPGEDKRSLDLLPRHFPEGDVVDEGPLYYHEPYFLAFHVPAGAQARIDPSHRLAVNWDDKIELLGYDLDASTYKAGETVHLTLYYQALSRMGVSYTVFAHLWGPPNPATGGPIWGQDDTEPCRRGYPTSSWDVGEVVVDNLEIPISAEAPSGDYSIVMGLYQWPSLERLPVLDAAGQDVADNVVTLTQVLVGGRK
jgi:4-amino-4-deoxy-L-arabinose transferase-like glycosyltransferase